MAKEDKKGKAKLAKKASNQIEKNKIKTTPTGKSKQKSEVKSIKKTKPTAKPLKPSNHKKTSDKNLKTPSKKAQTNKPQEKKKASSKKVLAKKDIDKKTTSKKIPAKKAIDKKDLIQKENKKKISGKSSISKVPKFKTPKTITIKLKDLELDQSNKKNIKNQIEKTTDNMVPEKRTKRAYRKSGKNLATSEFISTKFQPSNTLKDFVTPTTIFTQNGRRFGDEHRLANTKTLKKEVKPKTKYLSKPNINKLRSILMDQRKKLLEGLGNAVTDLQDEMVTVADPNDRASQETDLALELRERDRETKLIRKIDRTLERINKNDYGYCDICGIEIGMNRLEARPMATLCIDCKELQEFKEKQSVR